MATKNVQLKDMSGNDINPKTLGSLVFNNSNEALGTVEAGAEVNIIESVKVNGTALTPDANRAVDITITADAEYTIAKQETADTGMSATYTLMKDGIAVVGAEKINIPLDTAVSGGTVKTCTVADQPVEGLEVGDKYIDFTLANSTDHIYIPVNTLVDVYTQGTGIVISNNQVAIDTSVVAQKATTLAGYGIADAYTSTEADAKFGNLTYEELS